MLTKLEVPSARASIVWILGEFRAMVPKLVPDCLRILAKSFATEVRVSITRARNALAYISCVGTGGEDADFEFNIHTILRAIAKSKGLFFDTEIQHRVIVKYPFVQINTFRAMLLQWFCMIDTT